MFRYLLALGSCAFIIAAPLSASEMVLPSQAPTSSPHYEKKEFAGKDGAKLVYYLMTPTAYDAKQMYPLVLALHGRGGGTTAAGVLGRDEMRQKYPCFVMAPLSPRPSKWAEPRSQSIGVAPPPTKLPDVFAALETLQKQVSIDADRIYVTGQSMGGVGTFGAVAARPDLFAAAVPICGGWDANEASVMAKVPFWIHHGAEDKTVPTVYSQRMVGALKKAGAAPKYTEYPGVGHSCWKQAYDTAEMWKWLFEQRRTPMTPHGALEPTAVHGVPGATRIKPNGGWCWYQGPRAIVTRDGQIVFTSVSGDNHAELDAGDLWATSWNPNSGAVSHFELHDRFDRDDHNVAGLLERPDGHIVAVYGKHGGDTLQRWRITTEPGDLSAWSEERTFDTRAAYTYSNVFRLSAERGRTYNFSRSTGYNPNCTISEDDGETWKPGWRLLHWARSDYENDPNYTGVDGSRPYLRYISNGTDTIHFVTTEDHPRAYDNSIYHGYYRKGSLYDSHGKFLGRPGANDAERLTPQSFTRVFEGGRDRVAWTTDLELDSQGRPYTAFSVQVDGADSRGKRSKESGNDHRYWYGRFDGEVWHTHEIAHAGTKLYTGENDYTGLVALDPDDPNSVVISTNADPVSGKPLVSITDEKRHWELYRGKTSDGGRSWKWEAITRNSRVDNLRPIIASGSGIAAHFGGMRIILWCRGDLTTYTNYRLDICGLVEAR